jgi:hypothetical protein
MGMAMPGKTEYRKTGSDKVGKWTCDTYDGFENGQKVSEVCTVSPAALGLTAADLANVQQLADTFKSMMPQAGNTFGVGKPEEGGYAGMPVRTKRLVPGQEIATELTDVVHQNIPDAAFQIPSDFQKQDMGMGMGMGRGMGRGR